MKIDYRINNNKHSVVFASNKLDAVSKSVASIKSDKNILFIYDDKIGRNIVNEIYDELKLSDVKL